MSFVFFVGGKWLHLFSTFIQSALHFFFLSHSNTPVAVSFHARCCPHHLSHPSLCLQEKADRWTARVSRQCSSVMKASSHPFPFCANTYVNTDSRCPSFHRLYFKCICEGAKSFREVLDEPINVMSSCVSLGRKRRADGRGARL